MARLTSKLFLRGAPLREGLTHHGALEPVARFFMARQTGFHPDVTAA
jgi:hypothetical protein